jgi:Family of unknown function (DUF6599)
MGALFGVPRNFRRVMNRFTRICAGILCLAAWAHPAAAQSILPSSFADWTASSPSTAISTSGLDGLLGADAGAFREYVVKSVEQRSYIKGTETTSITLYRLRDPSSAYGAYTFLRNDSLSEVNLGSFASATRDRALIVIGEMLLDVSAAPNQSRPSDADLTQLANTLGKVADHTSYPTIGEHLPEQGRVLGSEHYVLGPRGLAKYVPISTNDWIGFDHSAETIVARYHTSSKDETLLVASYPTQQIAALEFDGMLRRFVFDPPSDGPLNQNQNVLFGKRVSSIVAVVVGAPSRQAANKLLDEIGYVSQVTWDEPKQTYTEPTINTMIVGAFMGTGALMILAVAAGIGFGGIRVFVKIFFPNKVFDRDTQVEILQLGITSKPIKAKDFY